MIIWIIGLSGSGKSTLAKEVMRIAQHSPKKTVLIDGDEIRKIFGNDLGYSQKDRLANAKRISQFGAFLDNQGINVVCAILSIFPEVRNWNRKNVDCYYEVFIDAPIEQLIQRDSKGIYGKYNRGEIKEVAGMDIDFPVPKNADLTISNNKSKKDLLSFAKQIATQLL